MAAFWDIAPCSVVEVDRRFKRAYCLPHQGDEVNISETSVNFNQATQRNNPECSSAQHFCLFGRSWVQISARILAILTEGLHDFPLSLRQMPV
jgi:hypothetical protein